MGTGSAWIVSLVILAAVAFILWWLSFRSERPPKGTGLEPPHRFGPGASVDIVRPAEVCEAIKESVASAVRAGGASVPRVVWNDLGDEVLVHLDSLAIDVQDGVIRASLDLESDQTGRETLVVPFAVGSSREDGTALAVTDSVPMGHPGLAARWGQAVQAALWSGVLDYARARADVADGIPGRIWVENGRVYFEASKPVRVKPRDPRVGATDGPGPEGRS